MICILGVVIANWNGAKLIEQCLESFKKQSFKEFKVYIIDNGSIDKSISIINRYKKDIKLEIIELTENKGFALANNIGIKKAIDDGATHILTINNDTELKNDTLSNAMKKVFLDKGKKVYQLIMVNYYDRTLCDAAGITWDEKLLPTQLGYKENLSIILNSKIDLRGACAGAAIYPVKGLIESKLSKDEYFDNNFFAYYEDVDLAIRLERLGYKTELIKDAIVYHVHSATGNVSNGFKEYYLYKNMFMYTKRNQSYDLYKSNKFSYYRTWIGALKNNFSNRKVFLKILEGGIQGIKKSRRITCIEQV